MKTAVARYVEGLQARGEELPKEDIAASFSFAVCDVLVEKAFAACQIHDCDTLVIGGGFSANSMLRSMADERARDYGVTVRIPPIRYCTDNGAMIAALGWSVVRNGELPSPLDVTVNTGLPRDTIILR